jgi:release factor glutamine methyltransferase
MDGLAPEVRDHEPALALTDGADGLGAYRAIAALAPALLAPAGRLAVELGPGQAGPVAALFKDAGLETPSPRVDLDGRARVLLSVAPCAPSAPDRW